MNIKFFSLIFILLVLGAGAFAYAYNIASQTSDSETAGVFQIFFLLDILFLGILVLWFIWEIILFIKDFYTKRL